MLLSCLKQSRHLCSLQAKRQQLRTEATPPGQDACKSRAFAPLTNHSGTS